MNNGEFCEELTIAGHGGQGVILLGKLLAQAAMKNDLEVTYFPAYGPEVRGGAASCSVVISDKPVGSPVVTEPDALIAMNNAALARYGPRVKARGLLVINRSLIDAEPGREDVEILSVPADDIALELGSPRSANMVALGAYLEERGLVGPDAVAACLPELLGKRHRDTLEVNAEALRRGAAFVRE